MSNTMTKETSHAHDIEIDGDCPLCARLRDPITGKLPFNAKAKAAMEESRAAMHGDLPGKWHKAHDFEKVKKDLLED